MSTPRKCSRWSASDWGGTGGRRPRATRRGSRGGEAASAGRPHGGDRPPAVSGTAHRLPAGDVYRSVGSGQVHDQRGYLIPAGDLRAVPAREDRDTGGGDGRG